MNLLREIFDVALVAEDDTHAPTPDGMIRLHLFAGSFDSEEALLRYCFDAPATNAPEPFTRDLPEATIDMTYVVVGFEQGVDDTLADFFAMGEAAEIKLQMRGANSIVVLSEYAFGGTQYHLNDTPRLTYLGERFVDRPDLLQNG